MFTRSAKPLSLIGARARNGLVAKRSLMVSSPRLMADAPKNTDQQQETPRTEEEVSAYVKRQLGNNWLGFGFYPHDKESDTIFGNAAAFTGIAMFILFGLTAWYGPDKRRRAWCEREAFLLLREREAKGIIPISPNLIDPSKFELPTDEELGDTEIII